MKKDTVSANTIITVDGQLPPLSLDYLFGVTFNQILRKKSTTLNIVKDTMRSITVILYWAER